MGWRRLASAAGAVASTLAFLAAFILPPVFFHTTLINFIARIIASIALGIGVSILIADAAAKAPLKAPKVEVKAEVKVTPPGARRRILLYLDLILAAVLSMLFFIIVFMAPSGFFETPLIESYFRLSSSLLFGFSVSIIILIILELIHPPRIAVPIGPRLPPVKPVKPGVKPIRVGLPVSLISRSRRLKEAAGRLGLSMSKDVLEAGLAVSPFRLACQTLFYTLIAIFISTPAAVALALLIHPALLTLMLAPIIPHFVPRLRLRSAVGDRRRGLEDELPFFSVFAAILQDAGINLYNSFMAVIGRGVFRQIEKDAMMLKRDAEFFFKSPLEALDELGRLHPNEKMRGFMLGYTAEWRSGGDVVGYLEAKAEDFLSDMTFKWRTYAERSSDLGETIISLFFIFPMLIVMSAFVFPAQAMTMTAAILAFMIPTVTAGMFGVLHSTQPKTYNIVEGSIPASATAGLVAGASSILMGVPLWLSLAASLGAATAIYGATVMLQMREISMAEMALPQFLRDVAEYRKMGYDLTKAIMKIAEENSYNPAFDAALSAAYRQMKLGLRMSEVEAPSRSWLMKICFFLLGQMVESGGGTVRCLELLTNFINKVVRTKAEARATMRLYQVLSAFTPIGLSFVTALMFTLLTAFAAAFTPATGSQLSPLAQIAEMPQSLMESCYLLTIAASASTAMLTAKTVDLTAKNTMWITINLALAAAGIASSTHLGNLLLEVMKGFTGIG